ncbi:lipoprotein [gut metagenome]|uniref:Lipoprotein n=1 Tax=gut metagenome TaxID=749906 RepID=J9FVS4_9ZZZZ
MRKLIAGVIALGLLLSCSNSNTKGGPFAVTNNGVDSASVAVDSILAEDLPEEPKPTQADEFFDDFIYNFASDDALQRRRIKFPLPYYKEERKLNIEEKHWKHDSLFTNDRIYTLLFDKEKDMDLVGDTSLTSVQVEWIYVKTQMLKRYYFERIKGTWILEAINYRPLAKDGNEDFVEFFSRFASDSLFQSSRIAQPLIFVTSDPDDDFSILETSLDLNQWFAFKPELPTVRLSNIRYGQQIDANSSTKILVLKGLGNGFSNILYFRRRAGKWKLYKFEDTSI